MSGSLLQFYWTRNEVLTAKLFAQWYYLYLLPVKGGNRFEINQLEVIVNPHSAVLHRSDAWTVEPDVLRCRLRHERMQNSGVSTND